MEDSKLNGAEQAPQAEPAAQAPNIIPLNDVGQVVNLIAGWHANRMGQLHQAQAVPDDVVVEVTDHATGEVFNLTPEQRIGFRAGLGIAISLFQTLPLVVEYTDEPPAADPLAGEDETHG